MADTVEQVYVWDGNDWVPVVRDETVSKTSELTNDGEDGVNPFITAADIPAVPDKKLPIDSLMAPSSWTPRLRIRSRISTGCK